MGDIDGEEQQFRGDLGEAELRRLAAEARLHAIQPVPDRKGWDFEIELPSDERTEPLDKRAADLRCKVQVKSVSASAVTVPIKLVNWERMAKQPIPWFVLVVVVAQDNVAATYLVYIGKYWIERTLETLRKVASKPKWQQRTMGLKWQDGEKLDPSNGASFRSALVRAIGPVRDPAAYSAAKKGLLDSVGYEGLPYSGSFSVRSPEASTEIAELVVGLRESVPVENLVVNDLRFGVPVKVVDAPQAIMKIEALPTRGPTRVTVTGPDGRRVSLEMETRRARDVVEALPVAADLVVLKNEHVRLVVRNAKKSLNLNFHAGGLGAPMSLESVGRSAEFVRLFVDLRPVVVQFEHGSEPPVSQTFGPENTTPGDSPEMDVIRSLADAWSVCRRVGLDMDRVVPRDLFRQWHAFVLARAALERRRGLAGEFRPSGGAPLEPGTAAMVGYAVVTVGEQVCVVGLSARGSATEQTRADGRVFFLQEVTARAHTEEVLAVADFHATKTEVLERVRTQITADLEPEGITILVVEPLLSRRPAPAKSAEP